jgi:hypothetical protein
MLAMWTAAICALLEAARPLRHNAFEAKLARLGEHDRALGGECFAQQDAVGDRDKTYERPPPRIESQRLLDQLADPLARPFTQLQLTNPLLPK